MSYINRRSKLFMKGQKKIIVPVRSEARMKSYLSATDARAWSDDVEERRQHILEYTAKNKEGFCLDKFIPIQVVFNALVAGKNMEIKNMRKKMESLQKITDIRSTVNLPESQKKQLSRLKSEIETVNGKLDSMQSFTDTLNAVKETRSRPNSRGSSLFNTRIGSNEKKEDKKSGKLDSKQNVAGSLHSVNKSRSKLDNRKPSYINPKDKKKSYITLKTNSRETNKIDEKSDSAERKSTIRFADKIELSESQETILEQLDSQIENVNERIESMQNISDSLSAVNRTRSRTDGGASSSYANLENDQRNTASSRSRVLDKLGDITDYLKEIRSTNKSIIDAEDKVELTEPQQRKLSKMRSKMDDVAETLGSLHSGINDSSKRTGSTIKHIGSKHKTKSTTGTKPEQLDKLKSEIDVFKKKLKSLRSATGALNEDNETTNGGHLFVNPVGERKSTTSYHMDDDNEEKLINVSEPAQPTKLRSVVFGGKLNTKPGDMREPSKIRGSTIKNIMQSRDAIELADSHQRKLNKLRSEIQNVSGKLDTIQSGITRSSMRVGSRSKNAIHSEQPKELTGSQQRQLSKLRSVIGSVSGRLNTLQSEISDDSIELTEPQQRQLSKLRSEIGSVSGQLDTLQSEITEDAIESIGPQQRQLSKLRSVIGNLSGKLDTLQSEISDEAIELTEPQERQLSRLRSQIGNVSGKLDTLESEIAEDLTELTEQQQRELSNLRSQIGNVSDKLDTLQDEITEDTVELSESQKRQLSKSRSVIGNVSGKLNTIKSDIIDSRNIGSTMSLGSEDATEIPGSQQRQLSKLRSDIGNISGKLDTIQSEITEDAIELTGPQQRQLSKLKSQIINASGMLDTLQSNITGSSRIIDPIEITGSDHRQLSKLRAVIGSVSGKLDTLQSEIVEDEIELTGTQERQLSKLISVIGDVSEKLETLDSEIVDDAIELTGPQQRELSKLRSVIGNLSGKLDTLQSEISDDEFELTGAQERQLSKLKSEIQNVSGKLDTIQHESIIKLGSGKRNTIDSEDSFEVTGSRQLNRLKSKMESVSERLNSLQNVPGSSRTGTSSRLDAGERLYVNASRERRSIMSDGFTSGEADKNVSTDDSVHETRSTITNTIESKNKIVETDPLRVKNQTVYCEICPCVAEEENECLKKELDALRPKCKEAEMLKLERDRLQIELNDLAHVQHQYENLRLRCCSLESAAHERDIYKQKYDEILPTECECMTLRNQIKEAKNLAIERDALMKQVGNLENNVWKQEEEIKVLMGHIERLTHSKEEIQNTTRDALTAIRAEVDKKDEIIATLEQQVPAVQSQLKKAIKRVSGKLTQLKVHIEELEEKLEKCQSENEELKKQVKDKDANLKGAMQLIKCEYAALAEMNRELDAAQEENNKLQQIANKMIALTNDDNIKKVLKQSECTANRTLEELRIQYKEWDTLRRNKKKDAGDGCCKLRCRCRFEPEETSNRKTSSVSIFRCPTAKYYNPKNVTECKTSPASIFKWPASIFRCSGEEYESEDSADRKPALSMCRCHKEDSKNKNAAGYKTTTISKFRCPAANGNAERKNSLVSVFKCPTTEFENNDNAGYKTSLVSVLFTNNDCPDCRTSLVSVVQNHTVSRTTLKEELQEIEKEKEKLEKLVDQIKKDDLLCCPQPVLYSFKNNLCKFTRIEEDNTSKR